MESTHQDIYKLLPDTAAEAIQDAEYKVLYNHHLDLLEKLEIVRPDAIPNPTQAKVKL
ncbi:unnamed protein product, partial [Allacma fusca]